MSVATRLQDIPLLKLHSTVGGSSPPPPTQHIIGMVMKKVFTEIRNIIIVGLLIAICGLLMFAPFVVGCEEEKTRHERAKVEYYRNVESLELDDSFPMEKLLSKGYTIDLEYKDTAYVTYRVKDYRSMKAHIIIVDAKNKKIKLIDKARLM